MEPHHTILVGFWISPLQPAPVTSGDIVIAGLAMALFGD